MAFKKVAGARKYFKFAECEKGQLLVSAGVYAGTEDGKFGIQHLFRQQDGEIVVLNSSGHLNWLLENHASAGSLCNVYYNGQTALTKGPFAGKTAHTFELEVDDDYGKAVKAAPAPAEVATVDDITL